jgi:transposase
MSSKEFEVSWNEERLVVKNEPLEIRAWLKTTPKDAVIALESTGSYGLALAELAHKMGRKVYVLAPRQIFAYRRSLGRRAKNDKIDAKLIAQFIEANHRQLHPFEPWAEPWKSLRNTVRLRTRLAMDRARVAIRMRAFGCKMREIAKVTRGIKDFMLKLDKEIQEQLRNIPETKAVCSPKGIGPLTGAAAIAALKQVPFQTHDAFVAYMGMDLIVSDSGKHKGLRTISSWGDMTLRTLFYMAGRTASQSSEWQPYITKLKERGMKPIQIHCAIARRLARIVFTLYHSGQLYDPALLDRKCKNAHPRLASQA